MLNPVNSPVKTAVDIRKFDALAKGGDVCILFYHWRKGCKLGAHFVALRHTNQGFVGYNTFKNSTGPDRYGESLEAFIRKQKFFGCVLYSIQKQR
jgi:hypothetical protein